MEGLRIGIDGPPRGGYFWSRTKGNTPGGKSNQMSTVGPDPMMEEMLARLKASRAWQTEYALPGWEGNLAQLQPEEEQQFQAWAEQNHAPITDDYDMRGFWRGLQNGEPSAQTAINPLSCSQVEAVSSIVQGIHPGRNIGGAGSGSI